jgi:hypothetical protein
MDIDAEADPGSGPAGALSHPLSRGAASRPGRAPPGRGPPWT